MRSRLLLVFLAAVPACQCFDPVAEGDDGGAHDAGQLDAGSAEDAGAYECVTASDCTPPANLPYCGLARSACVNHHCLVECGEPDAGRTCTHDAGTECLTCDGVNACVTCNSFTCRFDPQPLVGTCPAPFDDYMAFFVDPFSGRCGAAISRDGGLMGVWYGAFGGTSLVEIPVLGGTCLASPLATQIPRAIVSCPACTFVAEGCE